MKRARILSPWTGSGSTPEDAIRPLVASAFALLAWTDVSGQAAAAGAINARPSPNLGVFEIVVSDAVAAAILADATWGPRVLHAAGSRDDTAAPSGAELTALRTRLRSDGFSVAQVSAVVDAVRAGATRREIAETLRGWLSERPRVVEIAPAPE